MKHVLKIIVWPFLLGAVTLSFFSVFQKLLISANPFLIKGYIVPTVFGGTAGIVIGVLKRKWQTEAALLETAKLQAIIEMAGAVCHEMNQPMQSISGNLELLLIDMSDSDPLRSNLEKVRNEIGKMGQITRKLMRITKYETKDYVFPGKKIIDIDKAAGVLEHTVAPNRYDERKGNGEDNSCGR